MQKESNFVRKFELKEKPIFNALIVLGKTPDFVENKSGLKLSFDGKMRLIAAANLYRTGLVKKLIVSGGKTKGPSFLSEAELMERY